MQVRGELAWLFAGSGARIGCCTGGSDQRAERAALAAGLDIVVGTPGRLGDHLRLGRAPDGACRLRGARRGRPDARRATSAPSSRRCSRALPARPADADVLGHGERRGRAAGAALPARCAAARPRRGARRSSCRAWRWRRADREAAVVNLLRLHEARAAIVFCARREVGGRAGRAAGGARLRGGGAVGRAEPGRAQRGAGGAARGAGAGLRRDRPRGARASTCRGSTSCCTPSCRGAPRCCCTAPGAPGAAGRPGLAVLVVDAAASGGGREALAARAGLEIAWVPAPDQAARRRPRPGADAGRGGGGAGAPTRMAAAARLLAALAPERIAAAYRRLWAPVRPAPGSARERASG